MATITRLQMSEFNRTLGAYMTYSRRDLATILNTKGFFIARRAVIETPKASNKEIRSLYRQDGGRLLGKMINKRRADHGQKGLYGDQMRIAARVIVSARSRSIAFIKSGWLPAIRKLEAFAERRGAPRQERGPRQYGREKGDGIPARAATFMRTTIINTASATRDHKEALVRYGLPALKKAFDFEIASMEAYIARKLMQSARSFGIRTR